MLYKKHFLDHVIIRVDFIDNEIPLFEKNLDNNIIKLCCNFFKNMEINEINEFKMNATVDKQHQTFEQNYHKFYQWRFSEDNNKTFLIVNPKCIVINTDKYVSFDEIQRPFFSVFSKYFEVYNKPKIGRLGVRYIDTINLFPSSSKAANLYSFWSKYIVKELLQSFRFISKDDEFKIRLMNSLDLNYGNFIARFKYGIFNDKYPNLINNSPFIFDTDVFSIDTLDFSDVSDLLTQFKDKANFIFESSIKDALRKKMVIVNDL